MNLQQAADQFKNRTNWKKAKPPKLPRPTYWPFFLAMGLTFLAWGLLVGWMISVTGLVVMMIALAGWITELRHESRQDKD